MSKVWPSPQSQLKEVGVASTSMGVPSRVMLKVCLSGLVHTIGTMHF